MDEKTFFQVKRMIINEIDRRINKLEEGNHQPPFRLRHEILDELNDLRNYIRNVMLFKREKK